MKQRAERLVERITQNSVVRRVLAVMESANAAGAPLLATALAYTTMFAIIPGVILTAGVLGWLIAEPEVRAALLSELVAYVPPLAPIFEGSLETLVRERGTLSIIGLVGLLWGASNFYAALDEVMRRLFPGGGVRGFIAVRARGAIAVLVLVLLVVGTILLGGLWGFLQSTLASALGDMSGVLPFFLPLLSIVILTLVVLGTYLWVPTAPPSVRAALPPAIVAGIGIGLLTNLFTLLAPLLVGGLAGLGVITTVFAAFIWLNFTFQLLLWCAAWARYRRDRLRLEDVEQPTTDGPPPNEDG